MTGDARQSLVAPSSGLLLSVVYLGAFQMHQSQTLFSDYSMPSLSSSPKEVWESNTLGLHADSFLYSTKQGIYKCLCCAHHSHLLGVELQT